MHAPDLISRVSPAHRPDETWRSDITYIKTSDGWAYLATVIDLRSHKVMGSALADHMRRSMNQDRDARHGDSPDGNAAQAGIFFIRITAPDVPLR